MIWMAGRIVSEVDAAVSILDPTFEHGLGLFETFRTWHGRPATLDRHLERLRRSARALGLPLDPANLPDAGTVAELLEAEHIEGDTALRLTLSGGSAIWMRTRPLHPPMREGGAAVVLDRGSIAFGDPLARHKTLNYWSKRLAWERAQAEGADEAILATPDGRIWEGSRTNLFLIRDGVLQTPGLDGPVLPGVMRALVLDLAGRLGIEAREADVTARDLDAADEAFLTNAVRGVVPVGRWAYRRPDPPGSIDPCESMGPDPGATGGLPTRGTRRRTSEDRRLRLGLPGPLTIRLRDAILRGMEPRESPR